jgi:hypothetical protein
LESKVKELTAKAAKGDGASQLKLAMLYTDLKLPKKALPWFRRAAEKGYQDAQAELGFYYMNGGPVAVDREEGAKWFRKAAEFGHVVAQFNMGSCYGAGLGVKRNPSLAVQWYRAAADQGCVDAQYALGVLYGRGEGVPQDYVQSYAWVSLAADHGLPEARKSLEVLQHVMTPAQLAQARKHVEASDAPATGAK